jgi:hypothetical protein
MRRKLSSEDESVSCSRPGIKWARGLWVRGGKQAYPALFSRQQNRWQGPRTLSSTAARLVGYCLIVSLKHFRGQCSGLNLSEFSPDTIKPHLP